MSKSSFPTLISYLFIPSLWEGTPPSSYLNYPTGQPNQTLTGTTTVSGLTISGSNNITLGSGTVAPTVGQIGYIITSFLPANTTNSYAYDISLTPGVYIINISVYCNITSPSANATIYLALSSFTPNLFNCFLLNFSGFNLVFSCSGVISITTSRTITTISGLNNGTGTVNYNQDANSYIRATRIA